LSEKETFSQGKLIFICQFLALFKNVLKIQPTVLQIQELTEQARNFSSDQEILRKGEIQLLPTSQTTITPFELETSIRNPKVCPLIGILVTRLLQRNRWKI